MLRKSEESNVREILCEHQVQWRRGRSCSRAPGRFTCSPQRNPWRSRFILKDCSLWEAPTLKHRRNEGRNKYWEELLLTDHNPSSHPTGPFRVEEAKELEMEWCWAWWKGRTEGGGIFAFVFVSYHSIFNFNWQKKKEFSPSWVCLPITVVAKGSSCLHFDRQDFHLIFSHGPADEGEWQSNWMKVGLLAKINPSQEVVASAILSLMYHPWQ